MAMPLADLRGSIAIVEDDREMRELLARGRAARRAETRDEDAATARKTDNRSSTEHH